VKLVRSGNLLTASRSADGLNWSTVGSSVIAMPNSVYVGLAVSSWEPLAIATATFTDVTIGTPSAANQPPSVQLFAPTSAPAPATIALSATAGDADGAVTRVDFYANGQLVAFDTSSPFTATWTGVPAGFYSLTAVATDDDGATAVSNGVSLTVGATAAQPTTTVIFVPPIDYATNVSGLRVELRRASDATYAGPVAASDLGKPPVAGGEISVDISTLVDPLPVHRPAMPVSGWTSSTQIVEITWASYEPATAGCTGSDGTKWPAISAQLAAAPARRSGTAPGSAIVVVPHGPVRAAPPHGRPTSGPVRPCRVRRAR